MERESFEDEAAARLLNEHFISIKVDREERPDVDEVYMTAVQMMTGHGGWPMSVFLLPDGRPFYGGTYFPPEDRHGRPGFKSVVEQLARAYAARRDEVEQVAAHLALDLQQAARQRPAGATAAGSVEPSALLRGAVADLAARFDEAHGGFGGAPKFPPHHALALLLEAVRRGDADDAPRLLTVTLDKMALGGVYDHVGGGFHRYSTDAHWLLPHFEKMLYDNALLARVYADAFRVTGRHSYARVARETCDWVLRDMQDRTASGPGGFHAALDADSEGEEGKYYVWTLDEVHEALGPAQGAAFAAAYNLRPGGNFRDEATGRPTGTNIPHLAGPELPDEIPPDLAEACSRLLERRYNRVPPGKDDKVITSWNGLMIGGLATAGALLDEPRYVEAARTAADFCLTTLRQPDGTLLRRYRDGEAGLPGLPRRLRVPGRRAARSERGDRRIAVGGRGPGAGRHASGRLLGRRRRRLLFHRREPRGADRPYEGAVRRRPALAQRGGRARPGAAGRAAGGRPVSKQGPRDAGILPRHPAPRPRRHPDPDPRRVAGVRRRRERPRERTREHGVSR
jgi:uncharacterized protein YyaL (SSP411 family)